MVICAQVAVEEVEEAIISLVYPARERVNQRQSPVGPKRKKKIQNQIDFTIDSSTSTTKYCIASSMYQS